MFSPTLICECCKIPKIVIFFQNELTYAIETKLHLLTNLRCIISPSDCIKPWNRRIFLLMNEFYSLELIFLLQVATDTRGLMDSKSIFKDIGELESNLCQGSPPDPQSYPRTCLAGGVIGFV